jgi:Zn-dependent protease with chaperone function
MNQKTWLVQRAIIAIGLLAGFYVLAIAIALGLLWIPYAEWTYAGRIHIKILAICVGAGGAILWAIIPRIDKFAPPGPALEKSAYPQLFRVIEEVSEGTRQAMPADVYLVNDVNAWVTHRGGIMGFGSRRVMGIGLPLLQTLTVPELKAVLAHEFGHYHSGDVAIGPWIYKTRAAIARTVSGVHDTWLEGLFLWYGRQFLKVTHGVSRQQEFIADAIAANLCGPDAMARALRRVAALGPAFASYVQQEVMPVLRAGFLPPVATGFNVFISAERVAAMSDKILTIVETQTEADPFDTHPTLRERLNALGADGKSSATAEPAAATLIEDADRLSLRLVEHAFGAEAFGKLTRINWQQVGEQVYAANWRDVTTRYAKWLSQFTVDSLPAGQHDFIRVGSELVQPDEENVNSDERIGRVAYLMTAAIGTLLIDRGWHADTAPGKPLVLAFDGQTLEPMASVTAMADGSMTAAAWKQRCEALGIAGQRLARPES